MANGRGRFRRDPFFDCFVILSAVVFPPLAVLSVKGCNVDFCINLLLTLLGWLPGTIHAIFIIFAYPDEIFGVKKEELEAVDAMIAAEAGRQSIEGARERRYLFVPANVVYVEESRQYSALPSSHSQLNPPRPAHVNPTARGATAPTGTADRRMIEPSHPTAGGQSTEELPRYQEIDPIKAMPNGSSRV